jgi:sugar-phosphatase
MTEFAVTGFLFDCDGVLCDSIEAAAVAWDKWSATWAPEYDFRRDVVHGVRAEDTVRGLVASGVADEAIAALEAAELSTVAGTVAIPGAVALVSSLPPARWAVVTSGVRPLATARLASAGIPTPVALIAAGDVTAGKPDPEPYRRGAEALGIDPAMCVVFEDAPAGIAAAIAAGVGTIVGVGDGAHGVGATIVVPDLTSVSYDNGVLRIS